MKSQWFDNFINISMSIFSSITERLKKVKNVYYVYYYSAGTRLIECDFDGDTQNIYDNIIT